MEDDPQFNAGRGAAFTADGTNELDAAIMDGATLRAGGVTLVTTVKNPIRLARMVMERTRHVLLAGEGAEALARECGLDIVEPRYFFTERRWNALQRMKQAAIARQAAAVTEADRHGTVGAVALDANGNLAAATSTGGRNNKLAGRIGDSPVVGAGTYANNATVAVSGTGEGEYFMRAVAAYTRIRPDGDERLERRTRRRARHPRASRSARRPGRSDRPRPRGQRRHAVFVQRHVPRDRARRRRAGRNHFS